MKRAACCVVVLLSVLASTVMAQSGGGYDLDWSTVDGGGATFSTGGDYSQGWTAGQPDAGLLLGGEYALLGGFWGNPGLPWCIYLPLLLRQSP
jgi:hypothetical protein